jgi:hypothetical protein
MADNKFKLGKIKKDFERLKQKLPKEISDESRSFFLKNFDKQGFDDSSVQKWKEVQRRVPGTNPYKYPKSKKLSRRTKPILVGTGRLRRSIRITRLSFPRSVIATDVSYAKYVNDKRKFMGRSRNLDKRCHSLINKRIQSLFK